MKPANNNSWWGKWRYGFLGAALGSGILWLLICLALGGVFS